MAGKDRRVDAYIKRAAPFARPILKHLRKVVHAGCPDVEETIKWNSPFFGVDWITDAKRDETRKRRLQTTIEWLAEGKPQNWKYLKL